ncbi:MAG: hypothetical protein N838_13190 [Thiohalocapsa sp. PB-PSB1]|nr:MAG: hypothetical protein N838_13190 [Thiohalocapsa sp. PB-PSB1]
MQAPMVIILGVTLAIQLFLVAMFGADRSIGPAQTDSALLAFDTEAVTSIEIRANDADQTLILTRTDDGWSLPDLGGFPADASRIDQLVDSLSDMNRPLPVSTSAGSQKRFKVTDDSFERRLSLRGDEGELASLFIGDSPGFRRRFVRVVGEDAVYDLRLASFDLSANPDDWIDTNRLQLDSAKLERIASDDWVLVKNADGWRLEGSDQAPDAAAVDDLLASLSSLGYRGVLGSEEKPEYGLAATELRLDLSLTDGGSRSYRIGRIQDTEDYALKEASDPYYYRLAAFDIGTLQDLSRATLLGQSQSVTDAATNQSPVALPDEPPADQQGKASAAVNPATETSKDVVPEAKTTLEPLPAHNALSGQDQARDDQAGDDQERDGMR